MRTTQWRALCLVLPVLGWLPVQASAVDPAAGARLAEEVCVACHQSNGAGMHIQDGQSWPRLAGMDADYLYKQLQDIKAGTRNSPVMTPFIALMNDQQMRDVVAYYSGLPVTAGQGGEAATPEQLARGEALAQRGDWSKYIVPCKSCHGPDNQGVASDFPALAGQNAGYIADQLRAWQAGSRDNDPQGLMKAIAERLDEQDILAVSAWLATQPARAADAK